MELVLIESPFAGEVELNLAYLRAAMHDCLQRGEAPYASHGLYTQPGVLDDTVPAERSLGIEAGLAWGAMATKTVVYTDMGISRGMEYGIARARSEQRPVEFRNLPPHLIAKARQAFDNWANERVTWVQCPICGEAGMPCVTAAEGETLIRCTNHACASNGGHNKRRLVSEDIAFREPDWSDSKTNNETWKNPLFTMPDRLEMADGAVAFRDHIINNLRRQLRNSPMPSMHVPFRLRVPHFRR